MVLKHIAITGLALIYMLLATIILTEIH